MKRNLLFVLVACVLAAPLLAGTTYNKAVYKVEDSESVLFYSTFVFTGDAEGTFYTQAMLVSDCNFHPAYAAAVTGGAGTHDVNVYVEYSRDRTNWYPATVRSGEILDQLETTVLQADTVDVQIGAKDVLKKCMVYCRLKFVGQTGNAATTTVDWWLKLQKTTSDTPARGRVYDSL